MRVTFAMLGLAGLIGCAVGPPPRTSDQEYRLAAAPRLSERHEPDVAMASGWWPDLRDIWTPVGWKNHLFRFNVLFNGTVVGWPDLNRRTEPWKSQGIQLTFIPSTDGTYRPTSHEFHDDGMVRQGWRNDATPVLWSEFARDGVLLKQEVFGHIPGAQDVQTGIEPLFLWVRLSVADVTPALPIEKRHGFAIRINAPHISMGMQKESNITYRAENSAYPRKLSADGAGEIPVGGWRLLEPEGKVRLGIAPGQQSWVSFASEKPTKRDALLSVLMEVRVGSYVDLLVPMLPTQREVFDRELALGWEQALRGANGYWSQVPPSAAVVDTPEPLINNAIRRNLALGQIIAERNPADGQYALLTGGMQYANLWATPHAMTCIMFFDTLGYHDAVARYLEIFHREQGTVKPPGDAFTLDPGYLSTPKTLTSIDWLSDHGALLYTISEHALLAGDPRFVDHWTPNIVKACEFIQRARKITGHGGYPGIMPPAVATDAGTRIQAVWNDGWNYKGLTTAVRLLKRIGHPRASEFEAEARDYRKTYGKAFRDKCGRMPRWTDRQGHQHPLVPTALFGDDPNETRQAFYLDTGPLFLVYAGLLDADDQLMRSTLLWFREGPQTRAYRRDSNCWQVPCLDHEISSCEPAYSWNVFHSHTLGDRYHYLEGMYSLWAGMLSRQTFTPCETRGGITGLTPALLSVYLARLAVVDDQIREGELHLLRLMPLAWLRTDHETRFEHMSTEYGPVSVRVSLAENGRTLRVSFDAEFRTAPSEVVLHIPPVKGLARVALNGKPLGWDGRQASVVVRSDPWATSTPR